MTATVKEADAPPDLSGSWKTIDWTAVRENVRRLQVRIAKAVREGKWRRVKALQWLLTHSRAAKLLAVQRVTTNRGRKTPGVDGVIWSTPQQKWEAPAQLGRRGYRALPLRRTHIPKRASAHWLGVSHDVTPTCSFCGDSASPPEAGG